MEAHHGSYENVSYYDQETQDYYLNQRSMSADNFKATNIRSMSAADIISAQETNDTREVAPISVSIFQLNEQKINLIKNIHVL